MHYDEDQLLCITYCCSTTGDGANLCLALTSLCSGTCWGAEEASVLTQHLADMWMWQIHVYTLIPQLEVFPMAKQSFQSEPPLLLLTKLRHYHPNQLSTPCGVVFVLPFGCNRVNCKASPASAVR